MPIFWMTRLLLYQNKIIKNLITKHLYQFYLRNSVSRMIGCGHFFFGKTIITFDAVDHLLNLKHKHVKLTLMNLIQNFE